MLHVSIELSGNKEQAAAMALAPELVVRATVRALNRGIVTARTVIAKAIAADLGMKPSDVRDALILNRASFDLPQARLAASTKRLPLIVFNATGPRPSRGKGDGVRATLPGGKGHYPKAFIAKVYGPLPSGIMSRSGHVGVFIRAAQLTHKGKGAWSNNLPIKQLHGPSLGRVFAKYREQAEQAGIASFEKNFDHEMKFRSEQGGGTD